MARCSQFVATRASLSFRSPLVHNGQVASVWADEISCADRKVILGEAGDPASQTE